MYVLARIANVKMDPEELMKKAGNSGLVRYLFGDDLQGMTELSTTQPHHGAFNQPLPQAA